MKRITINGVTGVSLWDDSSPLVAFRADGGDDWAYYLKPAPGLEQGRTEWREGYDELGWRE